LRFDYDGGAGRPPINYDKNPSGSESDARGVSDSYRVCIIDQIFPLPLPVHYVQQKKRGDFMVVSSVTGWSQSRISAGAVNGADLKPAGLSPRTFDSSLVRLSDIPILCLIATFIFCCSRKALQIAGGTFDF